MKRIAIGNDHAGFYLKPAVLECLRNLKCAVMDVGTDDDRSVDYPDFAQKVAQMVAQGTVDAGILICGTGLGMAIAANKIKGVRAVSVTDSFSARMARLHNDANVLTLGARLIGPGLAQNIVEIFLQTPFEGGRHAGRLIKIHNLEGNISRE